MGYRVDSINDLPLKMRGQAAGKIISQNTKKGKQSKKPSKYHNVPTTVNGITFDSKKEADRYRFLLEAEASGDIKDLRLQHVFTLQEAYTTPRGERIRAIKYVADFTYKLGGGRYHIPFAYDQPTLSFWIDTIRNRGSDCFIIEDVKSNPTRTKEYQIKRKMMADKGYIILEV